jgi:hypothetical protein
MDPQISFRVTGLVGFAIVFLLAAWFAYPRTLDERPVFNSPRESVGYYLTERFISGHGFSAPLQHYYELPEDIAIALTPRDSASIDGDVLPKDFAGTMLLYAAVMRVHPSLALLVGPLFALLGAWAVLRITEEIFNKTAGLVSFALWVSFPPLLINGSFVFIGDPAALALMLLAVLTFVRYWREPSLRRAAFMSLLFCASVVMRYPNVLIAVPFVIALLAGRRFVPSHAVVAGSIAAAAALVVLGFNEFVYGSPTTTGFHVGAQIMSDTVNYSQESFFKRRPDVLWNYLRMYSLRPEVSISAGFALIATVTALFRLRGAAQVLAAVSVATFGIILVYYGQQDAWGYKSPQLNASVLRYLLPGFALLTVFAGGLIASLAHRWGRRVYLAPITIIFLSVWMVETGPGGVREVYSAVDRSEELRTEVVAVTDPDAVIAVRIMDKVLFPDRQTLTLTYAVQNEEPVSKGELETWDHVPSPERFAEIATEMYRRGVSLYFLPDARTGPVAPFQDALVERGFYLRHIPEMDLAPLYKVSRLADSSE